MECLLESGYTNQQQQSFAMVTNVVVAPVESLRDRYESFESVETTNGSNMIKYNKRNKQGSNAVTAQMMAQAMMTDMMDADPATFMPSENGAATPSNGNGATSNGSAAPSKNGSAPSAHDISTHIANLEYNELVDDDDIVLVDLVRKNGMAPISRAFSAAGPSKYLHFDPSKVNAAVVTCGGLCPGLNNVIRELVHSLYYLYGAKKVWGVQGGYNGFHDSITFPPVHLTNELVQDIHRKGGTILRSSRGGFDVDKILEFCNKYDISQLYIIGGDGTHRGAYAIHQECMERNLNIAVAGIPKTIDNDIALIDRTFGFQSAVESALASIETARTEATCFIPNGVGIVKLMGRSAGFLAAFAALGSGDVDLVLVPEVPIVLEGPNGILPFLRQRLKEQGYVVVVVAEGAGEDLVGVSEELDKGGNRKFKDIGPFLKTKIADYFGEFDEEVSLKYIDPSYMVRSVPANGADSMYCMQLAQNAVHGAMAGKTGFSVGLVNRNAVYLPIPQLVAASPRSMDPHGKTWEQILTMTGQPNTAPRKTKDDQDYMAFDGVDGVPSGLSEPIVY